jgi:hypothetical protein
VFGNGPGLVCRVGLGGRVDQSFAAQGGAVFQFSGDPLCHGLVGRADFLPAAPGFIRVENGVFRLVLSSTVTDFS